jgi:cobyrinic acid a,c-diamide synthase
MLLVVDARGAAQSLAAVALGCARHPRAPRLAGVIVNRIASERHARMVAAGFEEVGLPLFGMIRQNDAMTLPSRHLGLVQASETADLDRRLDAFAEHVARDCDLAAIRAAAARVRAAPAVRSALRPPGQRIAVARDAAFAFFYPHLAEAWRGAGAEIAFFSPLADEPPPADTDACWLPGGYPELHAGRLAGNMRFLNGLREYAHTRPVHGECGGYMVLGRTLIDAAGVGHGMAGLLPLDTSFADRRRTLGYRISRAREALPFAPAGATLFGHEFHYATITAQSGAPVFDLTDGEDAPLAPAGQRAGTVSGSFFHLIA